MGHVAAPVMSRALLKHTGLPEDAGAESMLVEMHPQPAGQLPHGPTVGKNYKSKN